MEGVLHQILEVQEKGVIVPKSGPLVKCSWLAFTYQKVIVHEHMCGDLAGSVFPRMDIPGFMLFKVSHLRTFVASRGSLQS